MTKSMKNHQKMSIIMKLAISLRSLSLTNDLKTKNLKTEFSKCFFVKTFKQQQLVFIKML